MNHNLIRQTILISIIIILIIYIFYKIIKIINNNNIKYWHKNNKGFINNNSELVTREEFTETTCDFFNPVKDNNNLALGYFWNEIYDRDHKNTITFQIKYKTDNNIKYLECYEEDGKEKLRFTDKSTIRTLFNISIVEPVLGKFLIKNLYSNKYIGIPNLEQPCPTGLVENYKLYSYEDINDDENTPPLTFLDIEPSSGLPAIFGPIIYAKPNRDINTSSCDKIFGYKIFYVDEFSPCWTFKLENQSIFAITKPDEIDDPNTQTNTQPSTEPLKVLSKIASIPLTTTQQPTTTQAPTTSQQPNTTFTPIITQTGEEESVGKIGYSVSLSGDGNTIAIGVPYTDGFGHVSIYHYNDTENKWKKEKTIDSLDRQFGFSVSLSNDGNHVAIGTPYKYIQDEQHVGIVRYYKQENGWEYVDATNNIGSGSNLNDFFGYSVSLNNVGNIAAILVPGQGEIKIYKKVVNTTQSPTTTQPPTTTQAWGLSTTIKKDYMFLEDLNIPFNYENALSISLSKDGKTVSFTGFGFVDIYRYDDINNNWPKLGDNIYNYIESLFVRFEGEVENRFETNIDRLMFKGSANRDNIQLFFINISAVSLNEDGNTVAFGDPYDFSKYYDWRNGPENRGSVYVLEYKDNTWIPKGDKIVGEHKYMKNGLSVSLDNSGNTLAVGNLYYNFGQVRVYKYDINTWSQFYSNINGINSGDLSGYSVSLSGNGETLAIGAPFGSSSYVRVYKDENTPTTSQPHTTSPRTTPYQDTVIGGEGKGDSGETDVDIGFTIISQEN